MNPYFKDYYTKRDLKEQFYFTDKRIKEFLGPPDRIEKLKGSAEQVIHLYAKKRVKEVMEHPDYMAYTARVAESDSSKSSENASEIDRKKSGKKSGKSSPQKFLERFATPLVEKIKKGRFDPHVVEPRRMIEEKKWGVVRGGRPKTDQQEKLAKARLKELVGRLRKDWDLNEYKEFFPLARDMKRKHTFFVGPTNSGKSYRGFNELATADSGVYLAPLRLLALEGQEEIEKRGKECSLLTGEEIDIKEGAQFIASTIEMANLDRQIDCALIDEVQLLLDQNRGWAWSQALVGIPAKRIIMTGSDDCIPTLRRLIEEYLGEELEIIHLERIGKLEVLKKHVGNLSKIEPGSAIIAFSRRAVLSYKKELEDGGRKVSVLYGNLSPGVRREEAKRFRSGETDILVATDCIGMGLNLPIKTVIFSETEKYDGKETRTLSTQEVKQIAGRAGRYGKFECGYVGVATRGSLSIISQSIHAVHEATLESCCVRPTETQLEVLRDQMGGNSIKSAISLFSQLSKTNSTIVCSDLTEMIGLAERIEMTKALADMSFPDKYLFTCAPVSATDIVIEAYIEWLTSYSKNIPVELDEEKYSAYTNNGSTNEDNVLNFAENSVKILTLYHWLSRKRISHFPSLDKCEEIRDKINTFIENSLKKRGLHRKCMECSRKLPLHHMHKVCDDCFRSARRGWS